MSRLRQRYHKRGAYEKRKKNRHDGARHNDEANAARILRRPASDQVEQIHKGEKGPE
jgi:hypothetical protein